MFSIANKIVKQTLSALVCLLLLTSCLTKQSSNLASNEKPNKNTGGNLTYSENTLNIVALAFISYAGDELDSSDLNVEKKLTNCINWELSRQPQIANQFTMVWGPSVSRLKHAKLDDNMMYAVTENDDPGHLIIAIRGTNPDSISDWFVEDFYVTKTKAWSVGTGISVGARISEATSIGLNSLINELTDRQLQQSIIEYLKNNVNLGEITKITVTGHSLAGALAPTLALYLSDTRKTWDNNKGTPINVVAIAGATPGNAAFATYYDSQLEHVTLRLHNKYDVVPHAWSLNEMAKLNTLYSEKEIEPNWLEKEAFSLGKKLAKGHNYQQILSTQAVTPNPQIVNLIGIKSADKEITKNSFANQAGFQHHCGYYQALGINTKMVQTNSYCVTQEECNNLNSTDPQKYLQLCVPLNAPVPLCQAPHF